MSDLEQLTQTNSQTLKYRDLLSCKEMEETNLIIVEESYHIAIVAVIDSMESRFRKFHGTIYEK